MIIDTWAWLQGNDDTSIELFVPNIYSGFLDSIHCQLFHASILIVCISLIASLIHHRPDFSVFLRQLLKQITQMMDKLLNVFPKRNFGFTESSVETFFATNIYPVTQIPSFTTSILLTIIEETSDPAEFFFITEEIEGISTLRFAPEFLEYIAFYQVELNVIVECSTIPFNPITQISLKGIH